MTTRRFKTEKKARRAAEKMAKALRGVARKMQENAAPGDDWPQKDKMPPGVEWSAMADDCGDGRHRVWFRAAIRPNSASKAEVDVIKMRLVQLCLDVSIAAKSFPGFEEWDAWLDGYGKIDGKPGERVFQVIEWWVVAE